MLTFGYVRASQLSGRIVQFPERHFDLLLTVGSWEVRSLAIGHWSRISAEKALILRFKSRRDDAAKDRNIKVLTEMLGSQLECSVLHLPATTEMSGAFDIVGRELSLVKGLLGRKLRVCVDISTMPRSLIAFLLLMGFRSKVLDEVTFFCSESEHKETLKLIAGSADGSRSPHVEGSWNLMSIPYGEGVVKGSRHDQIVISVGLDTYQLIDVVDRIEPEAAIFLTPFRGDESEMDALAEDRFQTIVARYSSEFETQRFSRLSVQPYRLDWLGDLSALMKSTFVYPDASTLFYPFGPKVHSIAMSLLALQDERIAVIGRTPSSYYQRAVEATDYGHLIDLVDLSSMSSLAVRDRSLVELSA